MIGFNGRRPRVAAGIGVLLVAAGALAGCAKDRDAMPDVEISAAPATVNKAKALQTQSDQNTKDATNVLDGK